MDFYSVPYLIITGSVSTPPNGFITLYMKDDGFLYIKRSDGTDSIL
jgi:hypothetical protein